MDFYETNTNVLYLCLISVIDDCMGFVMFWLIVHSYSDFDSDYDHNIRYICLDQYWVLFWVCTRYSDSISSRITGTIGDTMWHELTFCFLHTYYMNCFVSKYTFGFSKLLRIYVMLSWYIIFMKFMDYNICFKQNKACNIFSIDRLSVLGMILLIELTAHPLVITFCRLSFFLEVRLALELVIFRSHLPFE